MRDGAALITLAAETGVAKADVPRMIELVAKAYASRAYTSTQEQAWMVLAARALAEEAQRCRSASTAPRTRASSSAPSRRRAEGRRVTVVNEGSAPTGAVVSVIGAALTPEPPSPRASPSSAATIRSTARRST